MDTDQPMTDIAGPGVPQSSTQPGRSVPNSQTPGHPSFRRQRASRACETCHARKVRCDAVSLGVPCTNCTAFSIECKVPTPKRKKAQLKSKGSEGAEGSRDGAASSATMGDSPHGGRATRERSAEYNSPDAAAAQNDMDDYADRQDTHNATYLHYMRPKFVRAPIKEAGRVAYLGESTNLTLLVQGHQGTPDVVHYPLPEHVRGAKAKVSEVDNMEIEILHQRGAFLLPPRALCDELVEAYFKWVSPVVPVINRTRFMRQYRDPKNPPSLLLLQAVLLAGSRVCTNPQLMDANGSSTPAAMTFYKRAKALFDANYEDDRVTIVQSLILMGWYWEGPEDVTKNVFYWSRVAIVVAQGSGMHRSVENSQLSRTDKRLWKRIWWTLFARDRSVAVALGRPVAINPDDSDVEMVSEDDFIEDEPDRPADYSPDPVHVQFFLNYVKLCEIMGLVLSQQYSVASKTKRTNAIDLTHSDMALADWLQNCPREVYWERSRHHFWSALLHANYYTTLCLLHRAHMPPAGSPRNNPVAEDTAYPSKNIAYQAASMITSIIENLQAHDELRYTPAFIVYSLFSALIMHVYQMRSSNQSVVAATEHRLRICMNALKEVSRVWLVARMVHTLFDSILGNKVLEERLQKAAGKRHNKSKHQAATGKVKEDAPKRKFEDLDMAYSNGPPAPQVSYERSRPQTPAVTPSKDVQTQAAMPTMPSVSPQMRHNDTLFSSSRTATRPTSPFNPSYSFPGTPPDLFLVTRNSPNISEALWQNFQPDQLFPADSNASIPQFYPNQQPPYIDPQLSRQQQGVPVSLQNTSMQAPPQHSQSIPGQQQFYATNDFAQMQAGMSQGTPSGWAQLESMADPTPSEDTWSNSSKSQAGPLVPTTLNVEDWFNFFGINGEANGMNGF